MSDFNSPIDRDLMIAGRMGAQAATAELNGREIGTGSSDRIRYDFRKAVLSRYYPRTYVGTGAYANPKLSWLRSMRNNLNRAYYAQPEMISEINRKPEIVSFDEPGEIDAMIEIDLTGTTGEAFAEEAMRVIADTVAETIVSLSA